MSQNIIELEPVVEHYIGDLTLDEFEVLSNASAEASDAVPSDVAAYRDVDMVCRYTSWTFSGLKVHEGERFTISDLGGRINMGWGEERSVNVFGEHLDTGTVCGEATDAFPTIVTGWNKHCLVMSLRWKENGQLVNRKYRSRHDQPYGCSPQKRPDQYFFTAQETGEVMVLFNDEDQNNSGEMFGRLSVVDALAHFHRTKSLTTDWNQVNPSDNLK